MNEQFYKNLLGLLNRANKENKLKQAKKAGYDTVEEYKKTLEEAIKEKTGSESSEYTATPGPDKPTIHNVYIVDTSASMGGSKLEAVVEGINEEIASLKKETNAHYLQTVVEFNVRTNIKVLADRVPIQEIGKIQLTSRGTTALYQATGETLQALSSDENSDRILVKIFTDGSENSSAGKYSDPDILGELIKYCEKRNFTITFVGTEQDVNRIIRILGIDQSNTLAHNNTAKGVAKVFKASREATINYSVRVNKGEDVTRGFYKEVGTL